MIVGELTANREAVIPLTISGTTGRFQAIEAVIDTGFSEYLTLPPAVIAFLNLPLLNAVAMSVAGGGVITVNVYEATLNWDGQNRTIKVHEAEGEPLVGMSLLYGHRLTMNITDGSPVTIETLS